MLKNDMGFTEALSYLAGGTFNQQDQVTHSVPILKPKIHREIWVNTARQFAEECTEALWVDPAAAPALEYLTNKRGLAELTLHAYGIGFNPVDKWGIPEAWGLEATDQIFLPRGIIIPCHTDDNLEYIKVRRSTGPNKYQIIKGGHPFLFGAPSYLSAGIAFLFESELDAMLAWQTGLVLGYGSLPAGQQLKDEYVKYFKGVETLIVAYDQDEPGQKAADKLCMLSRNIHKAGPLPFGKDLTEYYQHTGDPDTVLDWLLLQLDLIGGKHGTG
jgi:DNA primase